MITSHNISFALPPALWTATRDASVSATVTIPLNWAALPPPYLLWPARDLRGDGDLWDYCVDDPINCVDPWGLFRFGVRSLDGFTSVSRPGFTSPMPGSGVAHGWIDGMNNPGEYNLQLHHEQGFYEDEKGGDIGHGKDGPMTKEIRRKDDYRMDSKQYDDSIMRDSAQITRQGKYDLFTNNCQDYADRLRENYDILKDSPEIRREIEKERSAE